MNILNKGGLVRAQRGSNGGYRLHRPAEEITMGDILRATEGDIAPVACLQTEENTCPHASVCPTLPLWEGLYRTMTDYLDGTTLAQLLENYNTDAMDMCLYI